MIVDHTTIREVGIAELIADGAELFTEHWDEVAQNKQVMRLAPDIDAYHKLEAAGVLLVIVARLDNELIGYSVSTIQRHLHYMHLTYAQNDVLFVSRMHRRGQLGAQLIWETERRAKARGAQMMMWHAKEKLEGLKELLPKLGYEVQDILYSKELR